MDKTYHTSDLVSVEKNDNISNMQDIIGDESVVTPQADLEDDSDRQKYNSVNLDVKIDIIQRVNAGEKKKELSEELGVNISTIKSILKKSDVYLDSWNKGLYGSDTKKMKGPMREDLDDAIYFWYTELKKDNLPVTGPLLCSKAMEFASRLGYGDFKASNGWLMRFKKRKGISLQGSNKKHPSVSCQSEDTLSINPPIPLTDMQNKPHNVFTFLETSLYYKALPLDLTSSMKKNSSLGLSKFTILMCTNLSATEKLPLVVFGTIPKIDFKCTIPNSPLQYVYQEDACVTSEALHFWLMDLDHWFEQQNRKISMIICRSPIHYNIPRHLLNSMSFHYVQPSSAHPLKATVLPAFKRNYRQDLLSEFNLFRSSLSQSDSLNWPLDSYVNLLCKSWDSVSSIEIKNSFQRSGIDVLDSSQVSNLLYCNIRPEIYQEYKNNSPATSSTLSFIEYVHIDDDVCVYDEKLLDDAIVKNSLNKTHSIASNADSCKKDLSNLENFLKSRNSEGELMEAFNAFKEELKKYTDYSN